MRLAALLIAGSAIVASAQAQTAPVGTDFLPIPDMSPPYLFAPNPLSGTMLRPFAEPVLHAAPEVTPEAGPPPVAIARIAPHAALPTPGAVAPPAAAGAEALSLPAPDAGLPAPGTVAPPAAAGVEALALTAPGAAVPGTGVVPLVVPTNGIVTVIVENVESDKGTVNVAVCNTALSLEGCPYRREVPAAQGYVETEFDDIPPGEYAVVGYHDVNGNDEFDKLFGMPREPYALSAAAADKLVPTFSDAVLPITAGPNAVIIRLKRLGG